MTNALFLTVRRTAARTFIAAALFVYAATPAQAADGKLLDIKVVTSPKGVTAWLVEDHNLPLISMEFAFHGAGAALDAPDKQGLAQMASNTLDEGADDLESQVFQKTLSDNSISLSFNSSRDDFGGSLKTLSRRKDLAFDLLHKAVTKPRFDEEPVNRMRAANLARLRGALSDPDWLAARLMNDTAFNGHPYALNSGGTLTTLNAITPADLKNFAATRLTRDRLLVAVAGDITAAELAQTLDKVFGDLPAQSNLPGVPDFTVKNGGQTVLLRKPIPQTIIEVMQPGIGRDDPAYFSYQLMNFIFGGSGFGSHLMDQIREKRGLTYGIYSSVYLMDHLKALSISASTENKNAGDVLTLTKQEMEKMKTEPVTDGELLDAKSYIIGSLPLTLSSTDKIAQTLLGLRLDNLPVDYLDTLDKKINAVTAANIQDTAKKILSPDNLTIILVGQPDGITATRTVDTLPNVE